MGDEKFRKSKRPRKEQEVGSKRKEATREELELLVSCGKSEFKPNPNDTRFGGIYEDGRYAFDPTHKDIGKVNKAFFKEQQRKRSAREKDR